MLNLRQEIINSMTNTVENRILAAIKSTKKGTVFFPESFVEIANAKAISKALQRLVATGVLVRIATGMYARPKKSKIVGQVLPGTEEIAHAIALRDNARIVPTGVYALNALGLSTQVPLNIVYLTDGSPRFVKVGNRTIKFKKTTPKNLSAKSPLCSLAIQALREIGKNQVSPDDIKRILTLLKKEKQEYIRHDLMLAPEWIRQIMRQALKN